MEDFVFISYKSEEQVYADRIECLLRENGFKTWIAHRDIAHNHLLEIPEAIKSCLCLLVITSEASMQSPDVASEIAMAFKYRKKIFGVKIDKSSLQGWGEYCFASNKYIELDRHFLNNIDNLLSLLRKQFPKYESPELLFNKAIVPSTPYKVTDNPIRNIFSAIYDISEDELTKIFDEFVLNNEDIGFKTEFYFLDSNISYNFISKLIFKLKKYFSENEIKEREIVVLESLGIIDAFLINCFSKISAKQIFIKTKIEFEIVNYLRHKSVYCNDDDEELFLFVGCPNLELIYFDYQISDAFFRVAKDCYNLKYVYFPDNTEIVSSPCFENCINLEYLLNSDSVTNIYSLDKVFRKCNKIRKISKENGLSYFKIGDNTHSILFESKERIIDAISIHTDCKIICDNNLTVECRYLDELQSEFKNNVRISIKKNYLKEYKNCLYYGTLENPYKVLQSFVKNNSCSKEIYVHRDCCSINIDAFTGVCADVIFVGRNIGNFDFIDSFSLIKNICLECGNKKFYIKDGVLLDTEFNVIKVLSNDEITIDKKYLLDSKSFCTMNFVTSQQTLIFETLRFKTNTNSICINAKNIIFKKCKADDSLEKSKILQCHSDNQIRAESEPIIIYSINYNIETIDFSDIQNIEFRFANLENKQEDNQIDFWSLDNKIESVAASSNELILNMFNFLLLPKKITVNDMRRDDFIDKLQNLLSDLRTLESLERQYQHRIICDYSLVEDFAENIQNKYNFGDAFDSLYIEKFFERISKKEVEVRGIEL